MTGEGLQEGIKWVTEKLLERKKKSEISKQIDKKIPDVKIS